MATVPTGDPARGHRPARRIQAGTIAVNHPYSAFPGIPVRRLQGVRLRPRARARDARRIPGDESVLELTGNRRFNPFGLQPGTGYRWAVLAAGTAGAGELLRVHDRACRCRPGAPGRVRALTHRGRCRPRSAVDRDHGHATSVGAARRPDGERLVLAIGLTLCGALLLGLALVPPFPVLVALLDRRRAAMRASTRRVDGL